jgi:DNA-binding NtrC family response regulator
MRARLLLIEDDRSTAISLQKVLQHEDYEVDLAARGDTGLEQAETRAYDVVLTDLRLPGLDGLEVVRRLHETQPRLPIILMTAHGTTETAIEATKLGAYDYLVKPFDAAELFDLIAAATASSRCMSEPVEVGGGIAHASAIVGQSRPMQNLYKEIGRVAGTPVTVLIRGDTGTGKELVARAIYQHSQRANAPFIAVNCAAIPETLLESELFGHERGAFTGAALRRIGRFEQAHRGTLFLDEVGDLGLGTQAKLLRVLQERYIQRLGSETMIPVDVRVIAATHRDLESAMAEREFREDLYYRLSVVTLKLPPLSERTEDIPDLVKYLLHRHGHDLGIDNPSIQPEAIALLQAQPWPGNVRELENVLRQALLASRPLTIGLEQLQPIIARARRPSTSFQQVQAQYISELLAAVQRGEVESAFPRMLQDLEPELYSQAIQLAQGNQAKAARWLGVTRLKMREKLIQYGLHPLHGSQND